MALSFVLLYEYEFLQALASALGIHPRLVSFARPLLPEDNPQRIAWEAFLSRPLFKRLPRSVTTECDTDKRSSGMRGF